MHIEWIDLQYRCLQLQRLDGMVWARCSATAGGDYRQVEEQEELCKMLNIEAGHDLYKEHPVPPGEAQRDAFRMLRAHIDVAARAGHGSPGLITWGSGFEWIETSSWTECALAL